MQVYVLRNVYYYNPGNGTSTEVTTSIPANPDVTPLLNDRGDIVWDVYLGNMVFNDICFYNGINSARNCFANPYPGNQDIAPQINNNGDIAWQGNDGFDNEIFYRELSGTVSQVSDNSVDDKAPQISDNGYVAWLGQVGSYYQVHLYNYADSSTILLSDTTGSKSYLNISGGGDVVWVDNGVHFYRQSSGLVSKLSNSGSYLHAHLDRCISSSKEKLWQEWT